VAYIASSALMLESSGFAGRRQLLIGLLEEATISSVRDRRPVA
jgi:hypothetical protein